MSYATWDIETTTYTSFKRKANPFAAENWVVTHAFKYKGKQVEEHRFGHHRPGPGWLRPVLDGVRLLVGFNIKFDLLHALQDPENLEAWMAYVAGGGNVWDCQLAEYLLCGLGQKDQMLSLDEVAPRYGGNVKVDEVKALWAAGVNTPDIDPELLTRYLCGGKDEYGVYQLGDIENTEKVFLGQLERARSKDQVSSIMLNMGALLFTVEAERNGMYCDKKLGLETAAKLDAKLDELTAALVQYLPKMPFDFNWNSRFHKSALFFGGTVKYDAYEYDIDDPEWAAAWGEDTPNTILKPAYDALPPEKKPKLKYAQMDVVCVQPAVFTEALRKHGRGDGWIPREVAQEADIAVERFSNGKKKGEVKTKKLKQDDPSKPKGRSCKAPFTFEGYTKPERSWASSDAGVWSTASEVIEELGKRDIPFLKLFAELQKLTKDLGTYYITTDDEGGQKGMLTLVDLEGIIHHKLNMCSTVTARLSSSDPNLQNIPKGNKSDVKLLFVSRFGSTGRIIQSDFSSLEVFVQAILTDCKQLIADLKKGLDLHCVRLAAKEGKTYEEVLVLAKGDKSKGIDAIKEWDYKRTAAKVYSFQRAFGAGVKKIAAETGMSEEEVQRLADAEDQRYPEIPQFYERITMAIKRDAKPYTVVPHPEFPGVMCHLQKAGYRTPDQKLYSYMQSPSPEYLVKKGINSSFSPTEIRNYVVQGTGGEWAKAAMWLSVRAFYSRRNFGGFALLVNQVHDAVYVDSAEAVAKEAAALLHACMEGASDFMEYWFKWKIPVPVPSDTSWGASMMDEDSIDGLKELAGPLREQLRREYMGGFTPSFIN